MFNPIDNSHVVDCYEKDLNYRIIINKEFSSSCTVVYFSSNGIYYPNKLETFRKAIINEDRFEWKNEHSQINNPSKIIFIRDIYKQWYLKGINKQINNLDKLISFIRQENTEEKLILIGVSSGGFVASLIGAKLNANMVFSFSGQFTLLPMLNSNKNIIVDALYAEWSKYYNLKTILEKTNSTIFYFACNHSEVDKEDIKIALELKCVHPFIFNCSKHGVPFPFRLLKKVISSDHGKLIQLEKKYSKKNINSKYFCKDYFTTIENYKSLARYFFFRVKKLSMRLVKTNRELKVEK
jgi:hypothetical protein